MTQCSHAHESSEHERISNLSFHLALDYYRTSGGDAQRIVDASALLAEPGKYARDETVAADVPVPVSYGDIVACVDYFLFPEKLIADSWKWNRNTSDSGGLPVYKKGQPILNVRGSCHAKSMLSGAQAAHNNHAHFQQDMIASHRLYHVTAVAIAKGASQERAANLYAALVLNAISDHYLQDYFAPGHIVTPRDSLSDVPATAMHDYHNERGLYFQPRRTHELLPLLAHLCGQTGRAPDPATCRIRAELHMDQLGHADEAQLIRAIDKLARDQPSPILMRGDQRLWDRTDEQLMQRLFMMLVQVRSILDVLQGTDSFTHVAWVTGTVGHYAPNAASWMRDMPRNFAPALAQIAFGGYCLVQEPCVLPDKMPDKNDGSLAEAVGAGTAGDPAGNGKPGKIWHPFGVFSPVLGASVQGESLLSGVRKGRFSSTLEVLPGGVPLPGNPAKGSATVNWGLILGYTYLKNGELRATGPSLRIVKNIPETEYTVGVYSRWLRYKHGQTSSRHTSFGARLDTGFSSYATLFMGVGRDVGLNEGLGFRRAWLWFAGFEIAAPWSRMPLGRRPSCEPGNQARC